MIATQPSSSTAASALPSGLAAIQLISAEVHVCCRSKAFDPVCKSLQQLTAEAHLISRLLWVVIWYRRNHKAWEYLSRIKMTNGVACAAPNKMIIGSVKRQ